MKLGQMMIDGGRWHGRQIVNILPAVK